MSMIGGMSDYEEYLRGNLQEQLEQSKTKIKQLEETQGMMYKTLRKISKAFPGNNERYCRECHHLIIEAEMTLEDIGEYNCGDLENQIKNLNKIIKQYQFALRYAEECLKPIDKTGSVSSGGEQTGNWEHVSEALHIIHETLKD